MTIKRDWDILSEEERKKIVDGVINFYETERREEIGVIAAGEIVDLFLQNLTPILYNKGVDDTKKYLKERIDTMLFELDVNLRKDE